MKNLILRTRNSVSSFEIPVSFVDRYLAEAPELALKVYLYLLRASLDPTSLLSVGDVADRFDVTPNKVTLALHYWAEKGLLQLGYADGELADIMILPMKKDGEETKAKELPVPETVAGKPAGPASVPEKQPEEAPKPVFDLSALLSDEGFSDILMLAEYYMKKPVTTTMREALGTVYVMLGQKTDLVEYLIEYCIDRGHTSPQYLKSVAAGWKEEGLTSVEAIRSKNASRNRNVYSVLSAFGIKNREPVPSETEMILSWTKDFELPIILEACRRTMDALHAPDFKYTNGILSRWKTAGVKTEADIAALDEERKAAKKPAPEAGAPVKKTAFHYYPERHTDYDALFAGLEKKKGAS